MTKPEEWNDKVWKRKDTKNKNPVMGEASKTLHGNKSEKRILEDMGAEQTIGSGAFAGMKSDGVKGPMRIECKSTVGKSMGIKLEWLEKIRQEALETGKTPMVTLSYVDSEGKPKPGGDWIMMPRYLLQDFMDFMENGNE